MNDGPHAQREESAGRTPLALLHQKSAKHPMPRRGRYPVVKDADGAAGARVASLDRGGSLQIGGHWRVCDDGSWRRGDGPRDHSHKPWARNYVFTMSNTSGRVCSAENITRTSVSSQVLAVAIG